jgi:succinyl-CoA synthetase beta subunit
MKEAQSMIEEARRQGRTSLSEYESKRLLGRYGIPVTREILVKDREEFPKALAEEADAAFEDFMSRMEGKDKSLLVQEMVRGSRELVVGMTRDPQFGPCVMFGLGGIYTEILRDVSFRVAPLEKRDALQMTQDIRGRKILEGIRGMPPADMEMLCQILLKVGQIGLENGMIKEIDINPLILRGSKPVAVDALVVLGD